MKILEERDQHIDVCKSFLVLGMILIHVLLTFYEYGTYTHSSYCITVGFIMYSGFIIPAVYHDRIVRDFPVAFRKIALRAVKFMLIFAVGNLLTALLLPERLALLVKLGFWNVLKMSILLDNQSLFAFDVLVPIALTFLLAPAAVMATRTRFRAVVGSLALGGLVMLSEALDPLAFRGLNFLAVGLIGCLLACLAHSVEWTGVIGRLQRSWLLPATLLTVWLATLVLLNAVALPITVANHIVPTILMFMAVYGLSVKLRLPDFRAVGLVNGAIAQHMLFAYLFHILVIRAVVTVTTQNGHSFPVSIVMTLALGSLTIAICFALNHLTLRSRPLAAVYGLIFR